jgi:hypothetical protein
VEAAGSSTNLAPGALGLWLTHEKIVEELAETTAHLHIIEDDVIVARRAGDLFSRVLEGADRQLGHWDLLFTETFVPLRAFGAYRHAMERYFDTGEASFFDLSSYYAAGTTSFFLNRSSLARYAALIKGRWSAGLPIDIHLRQLIRDGELAAYVTIPFLSSISMQDEHSNIRGNLDTSRRICNVLRRGFFIDADLSGLVSQMKQLTHGVSVSPLVQLYLHAYAASASDKWENF